MEKKKFKPVNDYAQNFITRISEIEAEVEPIRKGNVARAENLFKARLAHAMTVFKGQLKYDAAMQPLPWFVAFPDGSWCMPDSRRVVPVLRKLPEVAHA
jgi:hypothetical protein